MNSKLALPCPDLRQTVPVWARIGALSFGGPAGQIALMHRELVETRGWMSERDFLSATSFCMLLPGPEAMQIATFAGWRMQGLRGGLIAGGLFVLPGAFVILCLSLLYARFGQMPLVQAGFVGVQAAVIAIVLAALIGLSKRALLSPVHWALAAGGFLALFLFDLPFPLVIACAGIAGAVLCAPAQRAGEAVGSRPAWSALLKTVAIWGLLWAAPLCLLWLFDPGGVLLQIGFFFSKLAIVTFGGAYAVLAYMVQEVVSGFGWLTTEQMMDALGLAETTPGPLILVTQFVGTFAAGEAGGLGLALAGSLLTLWVTFVPCFLWIFALAPYVDWIMQRPALAGALSGLTAAVVGVILNLSLWFALHVLFKTVEPFAFGPLNMSLPDLNSLRLLPFALAGVACLALIRFKWGMLPVLAGSSVAAMAFYDLGFAV